MPDNTSSREATALPFCGPAPKALSLLPSQTPSPRRTRKLAPPVARLTFTPVEDFMNGGSEDGVEVRYSLDKTEAARTDGDEGTAFSQTKSGDELEVENEDQDDENHDDSGQDDDAWSNHKTDEPELLSDGPGFALGGDELAQHTPVKTTHSKAKIAFAMSVDQTGREDDWENSISLTPLAIAPAEDVHCAPTQTLSMPVPVTRSRSSTRNIIPRRRPDATPADLLIQWIGPPTPPQKRKRKIVLATEATGTEQESTARRSVEGALGSHSLENSIFSTPLAVAPAEDTSYAPTDLLVTRTRSSTRNIVPRHRPDATPADLLTQLIGPPTPPRMRTQEIIATREGTGTAQESGRGGAV